MLNFEQSRESPLAYGNWYVDCSSWIPSAFHVHMTCSKYILLYENLKWLAQTYRFKLIQQYKYIYIKLSSRKLDVTWTRNTKSILDTNSCRIWKRNLVYFAINFIFIIIYCFIVILVLFMNLIILFQLISIFIYNIFSIKFSVSTK